MLMVGMLALSVFMLVKEDTESLVYKDMHLGARCTYLYGPQPSHVNFCKKLTSLVLISRSHTSL